MGVEIHVNGPALLYVALPISATARGPLEQLGIAENGVELLFDQSNDPVMTDAAGPRKPADLQDMGEDCTIRVPLSAYDVDVAKKIRRRGNSTTEGVAGSRGRLLGKNGHLFSLVIQSENTDEVWRFHSTCIQNTQALRLGTRYTVANLSFYAFVYVGPYNTAKDKILYDHVFG